MTFSAGRSPFMIMSIAPDARNIAIANRIATRYGMIVTATPKPSLAPSMKTSYTRTPRASPYATNPTISTGSTNGETISIAVRKPSISRALPHEFVRVRRAIPGQAAQDLHRDDRGDRAQAGNEQHREVDAPGLKPHDGDERGRRDDLNRRGVDREEHDHRVGRGVVRRVLLLKLLHR